MHENYESGHRFGRRIFITAAEAVTLGLMLRKYSLGASTAQAVSLKLAPFDQFNLPISFRKAQQNEQIRLPETLVWDIRMPTYSNMGKADLWHPIGHEDVSVKDTQFIFQPVGFGDQEDGLKAIQESYHVKGFISRFPFMRDIYKKFLGIHMDYEIKPPIILNKLADYPSMGDVVAVIRPTTPDQIYDKNKYPKFPIYTYTLSFNREPNHIIVGYGIGARNLGNFADMVLDWRIGSSDPFQILTFQGALVHEFMRPN